MDAKRKQGEAEAMMEVGCLLLIYRLLDVLTKSACC